MYRDQSVEPFYASHRHVIVRSGVCVDLNGECCKKSNRKRVTKSHDERQAAMRKPSHKWG